MRTPTSSPALPTTALTLLLALGASGCSMIGVRDTPEQPYEVLWRDGDVEVRAYPPAVLVETGVPRGAMDEDSSTTFRRLFRYIDGANADERSIPMTAPVFQETAPAGAAADGEPDAETYRMAFVMPEGYELGSTPAAVDPAVEIRESPGRTVAALRFSGRLTAERVATETDRLAAWLETHGYRPLSRPRSAGFDPPWTLPPLRRNEIHVDVEAVPPGPR